MKYHGKITYTVDEKHPDIEYIEEPKNRPFTFEDTYTFHDDCTKEEIESYIKRDLRLVAGGGYNSDHIHNVTFDIERI